MTTNTNPTSAAVGRIAWIAVPGIVVGAVLLLVAIGLDWDGFWGGAAQGAGIGIIAVGAYFWGYGNGIRRGGVRTAWLPSQDAPE